MFNIGRQYADEEVLLACQRFNICEAAYEYHARRPEESILYRVVAENIESFLVRQRERGHVVPRFVERKLRAFLDCGVLARGFLRVYCAACRMDRVVPFSYKSRAFCPSCGGRRMAEIAAYLVDHVFPEVPVRQWVLSLPFGLRYRLAYDFSLELMERLAALVPPPKFNITRYYGVLAPAATLRASIVPKDKTIISPKHPGCQAKAESLKTISTEDKAVPPDFASGGIQMGSGFYELPSIAGGSTHISILVAANGRVRRNKLCIALKNYVEYPPRK